MSSNWIKHDGGPCPEEVVDAAREGRSIELQFYEAEGETTKDPKAYCWAHGQSRWDIVAYRIEGAVEPKQEPQAAKPAQSVVPIPEGWREVEQTECVEQEDLFWADKRMKWYRVTAWGYRRSATRLLIIRQLPSCYHRGCGSINVGVDR